MNWTEKKRIGEALKWHVREEVDTFDLWQGKAFWDAFPTEEAAWDAYQPDVLGEVIPWLEKNAPGWHSRHCEAGYFVDDDRSSALSPTFSEAVCALMLAVIGVQP